MTRQGKGREYECVFLFSEYCRCATLWLYFYSTVRYVGVSVKSYVIYYKEHGQNRLAIYNDQDSDFGPSRWPYFLV